MADHYTRRRIISALSCAGIAPFLMMPRALAADPPPETTSIRIGTFPFICFAPQLVCEEMLRVEGFTAIHFVDSRNELLSRLLARNGCDFTTTLAPEFLLTIDAGGPVSMLAGMHGGCYELYAREGITGIGDLKGKKIGVYVCREMVAVLAAYVGLRPDRDLTIIHDPAEKPLEQYLEGKLDAYMAIPPEPYTLREAGAGRPIVRTAVDRPWSQYFCCMLGTNREFAARYPSATKRVVRAMLKAADFCAASPEAAAQQLVSKGLVNNYGAAFETLNTVSYKWRDFDVEDTIRFAALRLREVDFIKASPNKILAEGADTRFLKELRRELKA